MSTAFDHRDRPGLAAPWSALWRVTPLSGRWVSLLLSLALVAAGWTAISLSRASFAVEGRIIQLHRWSGLFSDSFAIDYRTDGGRRGTIWLDGSCDAVTPGHIWCTRPDFPIGARLHVEISDFFRPARCPATRSLADDPNCLTFIRGRWKSMQRIEAIAVDGRAVSSGWSFRSLAILPYVWITALALLLAWHDWRISGMRTRTIVAFAAVFWPLFVPVAIGLWSTLH